MGDLYAMLGVKRTATSNEIKSAYRRLARTYHPDVNSDPAAQLTFARINEAYHTTSQVLFHRPRALPTPPPRGTRAARTFRSAPTASLMSG
jgi:DnaJ domain